MGVASAFVFLLLPARSIDRSIDGSIDYRSKQRGSPFSNFIFPHPVLLPSSSGIAYKGALTVEDDDDDVVIGEGREGIEAEGRERDAVAIKRWSIHPPNT